MARPLFSAAAATMVLASAPRPRLPSSGPPTCCALLRLVVTSLSLFKICRAAEGFSAAQRIMNWLPGYSATKARSWRAMGIAMTVGPSA
jgi:hypothetical protein